MTSSPPSLLLGACAICGEPIFRHRTVDNRQISCDQVRRIDQALKALPTLAPVTVRNFQILDGGREGDGQGGIR